MPKFLDYLKEKLFGTEPSLEEKIKEVDMTWLKDREIWLKNIDSELEKAIERTKSYKQKMLEHAEETYLKGDVDTSQKCCTFVARNEIQIGEYEKELAKIRGVYPDSLYHHFLNEELLQPRICVCDLADNDLRIQRISDEIYRTMEAKLKAELNEPEIKYVR